jgi:hypothetical protein
VRERKIDMAVVEAVPPFLHGNMETMCLPAPLHHGLPGRRPSAWLLRNRAGRSFASVEFEQELRLFMEAKGERKTL